MGERAIDPTASVANGMGLIVPHAADPLWESQAYCSADTEFEEITMHTKHFSSEHLAFIEENCGNCPVRGDCLADALEQEMAHGIYKVIRGGYLPTHRRRFIESIQKKGGIRRYMWEALVEGRAPVRPQLPQPTAEQTPPDLKLSA